MPKRTHGKKHTRLYGVWEGMKTRCYNPNYSAYHHYGGRGIIVCEEWRNNFQAFHDWAYANGYDEHSVNRQCTLDRIDNNGNYSPDNCRWISAKEQAYNRRTNYHITYNGETHTITEWAKILGFKKSTLEVRLLRGWSIERAFTKPVKKI